MVFTLNMFNTGQVTLPKVRRSKFNTKKFRAEERDGSLVITPIITETDSIYYENEDGFGVYFPNGISPELLISEIKQYTYDE